MLTQRFACRPPRRAARAFDLAGITKIVGARLLRVFCEEPALSLSKGRESEMPAISWNPADFVGGAGPLQPSRVWTNWPKLKHL